MCLWRTSLVDFLGILVTAPFSPARTVDVPGRVNRHQMQRSFACALPWLGWTCAFPAMVANRRQASARRSWQGVQSGTESHRQGISAGARCRLQELPEKVYWMPQEVADEIGLHIVGVLGEAAKHGWRCGAVCAAPGQYLSRAGGGTLERDACLGLSLLVESGRFCLGLCISGCRASFAAPDGLQRLLRGTCQPRSSVQKEDLAHRDPWACSLC